MPRVRHGLAPSNEAVFVAGEAQNETPAKINGPLKKVWRQFEQQAPAQPSTGSAPDATAE